MIVLADCGADPGYSFEDVENLLRKARIDLDISITFRQPRALSSLDSRITQSPAGGWCDSLGYFGTLQDLTQDDNESCLALATVEYPGGSPSEPAILILVKPNTCRSVSMDVANYKRQNPLFPQETTGDQFFSESQWESYFSLGTELGEHLSNDLLIQLRTHLDALFDFNPDKAPSLSEVPIATPPDKPAVVRASRSIWGRQVGAVGATLGAGAVLSLGVAAWQSFESYRTALNSRIVGERAALLDISQLWEKLPPGAPSSDPSGAANRLAVALLRAGDSYCMKGEAGWLMNSEFGMRVIADVVVSCAALKKEMGRACQAMVEARTGLSSMAAVSCLVEKSPPSSAVYWGYDYSTGGTWNTLHPCSTRREELVERYKVISVDYEIEVKDARSPEELIGIQESCTEPGTAQAKTGQATEPPSTTASSQTPAPIQPDSPSNKPKEQSPPARTYDNPICEGNTIYMQIYGPEKRDQVRDFRSWWHDKWHASVPPIEDVVATAFRAARPAPGAVSQTTVRYHDDTAKKCASAIVTVANDATEAKENEKWQLERLSSAFKGAKGVIEVWFSKNDQAANKMFK